MTEDYPGPPPELVQVWRAAASNVPASLSTDSGGRRDYIDYIATQAARWGADQELEACCEWLACLPSNWVSTAQELSLDIRAARRPKPPSLKEQALKELRVIHETFTHQGLGNKTPALDAALKRLGELEALDD
jgi:hypothetical protein